MELIERLEEADKTLEADGYKPYSYVRISISEAIKALGKPSKEVSLTDAEIFLWLQKQKYQTESGEQEYKMYFDVDVPKIIRESIKYFKTKRYETNSNNIKS